ncbi:hypothetical protein TD95_000377 [Thielaviopsis punctulata]|uniref:Protein kinase domain-containing protein n=1 Tax=Thielaviopsis punctulata TaxID=72032 RepID=A0A0F4ZBE9_9PEZI|nr:hypothetical protein TD95_000377 [Thielaviopsis punctulata]
MSCLRNAFENGTILNGRYRTEKPLNNGSFGMVFMATDLVTKNKVAIKCMTKKSASDEDSDLQEDFLIDEKSEELDIHTRLGKHPGIVHLLDSFETSSHIYLVLEFCERGDLYEAIRSDYCPSETEQIRRFMLQIVDAVEYMHSLGVYHRDIKPENIFITKTGSVKLGDFGLATTEDWCDEMAVGSDRYMAPEQFDHHGQGYSPAQSDIWSIGVCLLNILFARNPFTRPSMEDPLFRDFVADKQSLFDVFPDMSQDAFEVIVQSMSIDPSKRSLEGVRDALWNAESFTNFDEVLDDEFMPSDRPMVPAEANRAPLRTPSIQSPALNVSENPFFAVQIPESKHKRHLSAIPDEDLDAYDEPLFSETETQRDWCDVALETPGSSMVESNIGSFQSKTAPLAIPAPASRSNLLVGSMPIPKAKAQSIPTIAFSFGRGKGASGVSWSDLMDDDEDDDFDDMAMSFSDSIGTPFEVADACNDDLKEPTTRVLSNTSVLSVSDNGEELMFAVENVNPKPAGGNSALSAGLAAADIDADFVDDGFFFQGAPSVASEDETISLATIGNLSPLPSSTQPAKATTAQQHQQNQQQQQQQQQVTSPSLDSSKKILEKWEALGQRRRAFASKPNLRQSAAAAAPVYNFGGRNFGFGGSSCGVLSSESMASRFFAARAAPPRKSRECHNTQPWACSSNWRETRQQFTKTWVGLDY